MRARELGLGGSSFGALLTALLLPKCPLCIAALLSMLGAGGAFARAIAPLARPLFWGLAIVSITALVVVFAQRARRPCSSCCRSGA